MKFLKPMSNRHGKKPQEPTRSQREFAEEFGISCMALGKFLQEPGAPQPRMDYANSSVANPTRWYGIKEMRKWWASRLTSDKE